MSVPKKANGLVDVSHMMATWPQRFSEAVRRRAPSAKAAAELLGCCEGTAKRILRGEPPGADTLVLACSIYGKDFTLEMFHPGSDTARDVALAEAFRRFAADMDERLAA